MDGVVKISSTAHGVASGPETADIVIPVSVKVSGVYVSRRLTNSGIVTLVVEALNTVKGVPNGIAPLDGTGKVPLANLPPLGGGSGSPPVQETPSGPINGSNITFTLSVPPDAGLILTRNGVEQAITVNYTLVGNTITFIAGSIPQTGDTLNAIYWTL